MNYETSITISSNIEVAFDAISHKVDQWWGKVNDVADSEFAIHFGETEWRFKIIQHQPYENIIWRCIKASHYHEGLSNIKEEWLNTELHWEFLEINSEVRIKFTHKGLTQNLNCFDVCKTGWDYYILTSLKITWKQEQECLIVNS